MAKAMSDKGITTASVEGLAATIKAAKAQDTPPVHLWNPPFCGDIDIRIARDGTWYHEGGAIRRPAMVRLFSGILKKEGDRYFLVTPVEKVGIVVEDAPFVAVDVEATGQGDAQMLHFETNVGDIILAGKAHPIRVVRDAATAEPAPYVMVRAGLEALIDRKTYYRLMELGTHHAGWFGLWSGGEFFAVIPSDALRDL